MWRASQKAEAASKEYNQLVDDLNAAEAEGWAAELFDKSVLSLRSDIRSDTYRPLKSAYNRYTFWKGEVDRYSNLLLAEQAYSELYKDYRSGQSGGI